MSDLFKNLRSYDRKKPQEVVEVGGILGLPVKSQTVEVPGRDAYVYVRIRNSSEIVQAFNDKVTPVYNLPVLMVWDRGGYRISGRDIKRYSGWGSNYSYLPKHGGQHSFYGGDTTYIYSQQFIPLLAIPSGTSGAVYIEPHVYRNPVDASWNYIGNQYSDDILASKPTDNLARMMLLYWDLDSESVEIASGSAFAATTTGISNVLPYLPLVTNERHIAIAGVRLVSGTTDISWDELYDLRQFTTTTPGSFAGGFCIQDEGVPLGTGTTLNFVGNNVDASISGSVFRIFVTGSTSGGGAPGGSNTQLQYNNAGSFDGTKIDYSYGGGIARFQLENQTTTGSAGDEFYINAANGNGTGSGGSLRLNAGGLVGEVPGSSNARMVLYGKNNANAGNVHLYGANTTGSAGGDIYLEPGYGTGTASYGMVKIVDPLTKRWGALVVENISDYREYAFPDEAGTVLLDAPSNGVVYGRKDGAWTPATGSVTASPPITGSVVILDDGGAKGSALILNFGDYLSATISGSTALINVTDFPDPPAPVNTDGVIVWDDGAPLGTGSVLNFVGSGIDASISGTIVRVSVVGAGGSSYAYLRDQKDSGTDGGTIVANTWTKRDLTNIISDDDSIVSSLSSGTFLMDAGTYRIHATAPSFQTNASRIILWDYASSAMLLLGKTSYINNGGNATLVGQFALTGSTYLQILEIVEFEDDASWQLGPNMHDRASNDSYYEIYTEVELWKLT